VRGDQGCKHVRPLDSGEDDYWRSCHRTEQDVRRMGINKNVSVLPFTALNSPKWIARNLQCGTRGVLSAQVAPEQKCARQFAI